MSSYYVYGYNNPPPMFPEVDEITSSMNSAIVAALISTIVGTVALVAIVYFVIDCLKKMGTAIPNYAKIATASPEDPTDEIVRRNPSRVAPYSLSLEMWVDRAENFDFETTERFLKPKRFSSDELSAFTENFSVVLGSGAYGVVFKGKLPNGLAVAVKVLSTAADNDQFMAEVGSIGRTHHINLVRLLGYCFDSTTRALVFEFMENGSLDRLLFGEGITSIEWPKLREIAIGTAKGIAYLHEECQERIVHYDIKPGNVLLDKNLVPKVADFGLAKLINRESSHIAMTGFRGTPGYAAPELWKPFPVTFKCDVYSFGMLLFEIVARRKNHVAESSQNESRKWLPRWTWDMFRHDELALMVSFFGVREQDRADAERMLKVALLCIQYLPEARPVMSSVVKMLEGDMEVPSPVYPFEYLDPVKPCSGTQKGSEFDSDGSTVKTVYCNGSCSKPEKGKAMEIELCTS